MRVDVGFKTGAFKSGQNAWALSPGLLGLIAERRPWEETNGEAPPNLGAVPFRGKKEATG